MYKYSNCILFLHSNLNYFFHIMQELLNHILPSSLHKFVYYVTISSNGFTGIHAQKLQQRIKYCKKIYCNIEIY